MQLDVTSNVPSKMRVTIICDNDEMFFASIALVGGNVWQNVLLKASDFKNTDGISLGRFSDGRIMIFKCDDITE
jgi:hypothetical protein